LSYTRKIAGQSIRGISDSNGFLPLRKNGQRIPRSEYASGWSFAVSVEGSIFVLRAGKANAAPALSACAEETWHCG